VAVRPPVALICPPPPYAWHVPSNEYVEAPFPPLPARVLALSGGLPIKGRPRSGRRARTTTSPRLASTRWPPSLSEPIRLNRHRPLLALTEADGLPLLSCKPGPAKRPAWPDLTRLLDGFGVFGAPLRAHARCLPVLSAVVSTGLPRAYSAVNVLAAAHRDAAAH
jgi:hypothetical protein